MGRRTLTTQDIAWILSCRQAGLRQSEIVRTIGIDRKTVVKYVTAATADGMGDDGRPLSPREWENWAARRFPELADGRLRRVTWVSIGAHDALIADLLRKGASVPAVHRELRKAGGGCAVSLSSLRRYVADRFPAPAD